MSIFVIGINNKTASIAEREKVFFAPDKLSFYLQDLLSRGSIEDAVLLSTCNRSELYCDTEDFHLIQDWFYAQTTLSHQELEPLLYVYQDEKAVAHIMRVAAGLDSMIVGEPQILGQMKNAFAESIAAGAVGPLFHRLFQQVFATAKEIRTTTAIGACPVSVASTASHFIKLQVNLEESTVMLMGAGETSALLLRYLSTQMNRPVLIVNRRMEKAIEMLQSLPGKAYGFDQLLEALVQADVVFAATGSAMPLIDQAMMEKVMRLRHGKPLIMMDMAVPRNIQAEVATLPGIKLFCIDHLKAIIEKNLQGREHAALKADDMIWEKSRAFIHDLASFDHAAYTIRAYRKQIENLCCMELQRAKLRLHQGMDATETLDAFAYAFTQKLLHAPSVQLRQAAASGRFELLRFAKQLFSLPDPEIERL